MTRQKKPAPEKEKPRNFWLEGEVSLADLPDIKKGLKHVLKNHPELKASHAAKGMLDWKQQPDGFTGLVNIIAAQQISTAAAGTILTRLHAAIPEMTPRRFLKADDATLRAAGFSGSKISYARGLAESIVSKKFDPRDIPNMDDAEAFKALTSLKGIGLWSAEIYLMFSLGRGDIWPAGDIALQKGLQNIHKLKERPAPDHTRTLGDKWAPHRSAASLIVWRA
jgi:DNA-3-methyladenine glycosylase II